MNTHENLGNVDQAIKNLEHLTEIFEKCANKPSLYNTDFGYYLEQMSYEMFKTANELKQRRYLFCDA